MKFQIGQVFISVQLPNWGAQFALKIIAPIGATHMLKIDVLGDSGAAHQIDANLIVYERGDADAEKSAIE